MQNKQTVEPPVSDHPNAKISGRLRKVVVYKNRTAGGIFREEG